MAGDARHDSMGHNAKYGAYSILSCAESKIIHFELVQVNGIQCSPDTACVQNIKLVRWCSLKVQSFDYHMFKLCSKTEVFQN